MEISDELPAKIRGISGDQGKMQRTQGWLREEMIGCRGDHPCVVAGDANVGGVDGWQGGAGLGHAIF